jgi:hypothetical protein
VSPFAMPWPRASGRTLIPYAAATPGDPAKDTRTLPTGRSPLYASQRSAGSRPGPQIERPAVGAPALQPSSSIDIPVTCSTGARPCASRRRPRSVGGAAWVLPPEELHAASIERLRHGGDLAIGIVFGEVRTDDSVVREVWNRRLVSEHAVLVDQRTLPPAPQVRPVGSERFLDVASCRSFFHSGLCEPNLLAPWTQGRSWAGRRRGICGSRRLALSPPFRT